MLSEPIFTFTIPSIRDDVDLECRVYHPLKFRNGDSAGKWIKKGAIVAHPYAPMGGCFDDPVVVSVTSMLLKQDFIVGLFNFRGAGNSKGRTSWTSKPEVGDYVSFTGFMLHYLRIIDPPITANISSSALLEPHGTPLATIQSAAVSNPELVHPRPATTLVLGGYSYGSLVAISIPSIDEIITRFEDSIKGSAAAEICLRAVHLSTQWNTEARERQRGRSLTVESGPRSPSTKLYGGDESEPGTRRLSRDSRRSIDIVRRSVDVTRKKMGRKTHRSDESLHAERLQADKIDKPRICFLLISPLLPPISSFLTVFSGSHLFSKTAAPAIDTQKLTRHQTMAIYGDNDYFTSAKKLRKWARELESAPESQFTHVEIEGAGHFWHESGVEPRMKDVLKQWLTKLES